MKNHSDRVPEDFFLIIVHSPVSSIAKRPCENTIFLMGAPAVLIFTDQFSSVGSTIQNYRSSYCLNKHSILDLGILRNSTVV